MLSSADCRLCKFCRMCFQVGVAIASLLHFLLLSLDLQEKFFQNISTVVFHKKWCWKLQTPRCFGRQTYFISLHSKERLIYALIFLFTCFFQPFRALNSFLRRKIISSSVVFTIRCSFSSVYGIFHPLSPKNGAFILFKTFPPWWMQFSTDDCLIHSGGFDFQLINGAFSCEVKEIRGWLWEIVSRGETKRNCRKGIALHLPHSSIISSVILLDKEDLCMTSNSRCLSVVRPKCYSAFITLFIIFVSWPNKQNISNVVIGWWIK